MDYMILDSSGNALGAYDDEIAAHAALRSIAEAAPEAADIALLAYVDGTPVGAAVTPADLPLATYSVEFSFIGRVAQLSKAAGVAAAPDWERRLADSAV